MDLSAFSLQPTEGKIALAFLDGEDGEPERYPSPSTEPGNEELLVAVVIGVGPKVTGVKKGDTVAVSSWARNSPKIGDTHITDSYCVYAKIKAE